VIVGAPTQVAIARANMTARSREVLPESLLAARVGRGTLAGALNDQVRFRVVREGAPSDWAIVPDTKLAADLVASRAGNGLLRQLRVAIESTGSLGDRSNLKGFVLPDDLDSVIAARALSALEAPAGEDGETLARAAASGDVPAAERVLHEWRDYSRLRSARAGAWNAKGWITFAPHTARAMLVAAGAYAPDRKIEPQLLEAGARTTYLSGDAPHEVQHSITPRTGSASAAWLEEGIANVFSRTPVFHRANARRAGLTPERYASQLSHAPWFQTGWTTYRRPELTPTQRREKEQAARRNYGDSQVVLRDLVHLAGGDFRSTDGRATTVELLQSKQIRYVPGMLADAIIERHDLDPAVRERLRLRIAEAVDIKGGAATIAREFGIAGR
jgi:hypothetical protein